MLCLASSVQVSANGVFWQPQERDLRVSNEAWASLMEQIKQQGFNQLILQWTRYGDSFSSLEQINALQEKVSIAVDNGLEPVFGLYLDPEFFSLQKQPTSALNNYLREQRSLSIQQARLWYKLFGESIAGWYVSAEIDDENWRTVSNQHLLEKWLQETITELHKIKSKPVYISTFFTGKMSPLAYERLLERVHHLGYQVWVQDGAGVGVLSDSHRNIYLNQVLQCNPGSVKPVSGVIYEVFDVVSNQPFIAKPKPDAVIEQLIKKKEGCGAQRLFFSLRYLPASQGVLHIE